MNAPVDLQEVLRLKFLLQMLKRSLSDWTKKIQDHAIIITFDAKPSDKRNANTARKSLGNLWPIFELRVFGLYGLKFDGDFLT